MKENVQELKEEVIEEDNYSINDSILTEDNVASSLENIETYKVKECIYIYNFSSNIFGFIYSF